MSTTSIKNSFCVEDEKTNIKNLDNYFLVQIPPVIVKHYLSSILKKWDKQGPRGKVRASIIGSPVYLETLPAMICSPGFV